ncbi:MAG: GNAT family N-acetyltransferase [Deltaproteobacteria bacterium]|nr:GNAT family N-acetyltransferase [Deltaproteobacteria bacterium]
MTTGLLIREAAIGSTDYLGARRLRYEVLRRPIGWAEGTERQAVEDDATHWVAVDAGGQVIGCVMMHDQGDGTARLLQMAVAEPLQRRDIGRALVEALEARARERGVHTITLHARETAIPFYQRLGYATVGEPYVEVTLPHQTMQRRL